jgi:hypothetical protein
MTERKENGNGRKEEFKLSGSEIIEKIKDLIHQGNIRRLILKTEEGKTLFEIPLTLGVVGAALAPVLAAVGACAALVAKMTLVVEKEEEEVKEKEKKENRKK